MSKKDNTNDTEHLDTENTNTVTDEAEQNDTTTPKQDAEDTLSAEAKLEKELASEKDKFMRLFAEFENYKRRTNKERIELFKTANKEVMLAMLPILDDFERALTHIEDDKEAEELRKGVLLIYQKLVNTLEQKGLKKVDAKQGDTFNADNHEAVTQIPAPSEDLKGKIIDIVECGYTLGEKVIRFPKVVIGQ